MKKKVTLSLESSIYGKFQDYCEENAIMLSRKVEMFMQAFLDENLDSQTKNEVRKK